MGIVYFLGDGACMFDDHFPGIIFRREKESRKVNIFSCSFVFVHVCEQVYKDSFFVGRLKCRKERKWKYCVTIRYVKRVIFNDKGINNRNNYRIILYFNNIFI